mgnify:CR=1 FL=1
MTPAPTPPPTGLRSSAAVPDTRVLVVGTTTDYVHWIDRTWPGRALFVTDPAERSRGIEPAPDERTELLEDLRNSQRVRRALTAHLRRHDIRLGGITCYDCEALALAAKLAQALELPYPSLDTVELCRDKFECKSVWRAADVPCPDGAIIHTAAEAVAFQQRVGGVCVLKPPTGSGSEYVFLCNGPDEAAAGVTSIQQAMVRQAGNRMYAGARERIVAEQYAVGAQRKRLEHEGRVDPPAAHHADDADVGRILDPRRARQVGGTVGTPVAHETDDLRFEIITHSQDLSDCVQPGFRKQPAPAGAPARRRGCRFLPTVWHPRGSPRSARRSAGC